MINRYRGNPALLAAFAIITLTVIVFGRALGFGLFGDADLVLKPWISSPSPMIAFTDVAHGLWMPVTYLSWMLDAWVFGTQKLTAVDAYSTINIIAVPPAWHHVMDLVWHAGAGGLLYVLLQRLSVARMPALLATLIWLVHPLQLDTVAQVAERKNTVCMLFMLASCIAWVDKRVILAFVFSFLAIASKPTACVLPILFILLEAMAAEFDIRKIKREAVISTIPFFTLSFVLGFVALITQTQATMRTPPDLMVSLSNIAMLTFHVLVPIDLAPTYAEYTPAKLAWLPLAGVAVVVVLLTSAYKLRNRNPLAAVGLIWFLVTMAPALNLSMTVGISEHYDHYMYAPLVGIAMVLASLTSSRVLLAIIIACAGLSIAQIGRWDMMHVDSMIDANRSTAHGQLALCEMRKTFTQDHAETLQCAQDVMRSTRFWWQQADAAKLAMLEGAFLKDIAAAQEASIKYQEIVMHSTAWNNSRWWMRAFSATR